MVNTLGSKYIGNKYIVGTLICFFKVLYVYKCKEYNVVILIHNSVHLRNNVTVS
jgi:hypothetical protein